MVELAGGGRHAKWTESREIPCIAQGRPAPCSLVLDVGRDRVHFRCIGDRLLGHCCMDFAGQWDPIYCVWRAIQTWGRGGGGIASFHSGHWDTPGPPKSGQVRVCDDVHRSTNPHRPVHYDPPKSICPHNFGGPLVLSVRVQTCKWAVQTSKWAVQTSKWAVQTRV